MPYHTFNLGGVQRLQAFFGPVRWINVSLMAISKTAGASYQQTNAPGSMHRPLPAGRPLGAPLPWSKSIPERTHNSFLMTQIQNRRFSVVMGMSKKTRRRISLVPRTPTENTTCSLTHPHYLVRRRLYCTSGAREWCVGKPAISAFQPRRRLREARA